MPWLKPGGDLAEFFERVRDAPERLLLLDYDGTLAPFRDEPMQAVPYPGVRERLAAMLRDGGSRMVVISGRATRDLTTLLGLERFPEMWGCHGAERLLPDGTYQLKQLPAGTAEVVDAETDWLKSRGYAQRVERKPAGMALHWRGMPPEERDALEAQVRARWSRALEAQPGRLTMHAFDGGLELRLPGVDKGRVVREILQQTSPQAAVAFLGDDLTDEDAFRALAGRGLSVLVRDAPRPTAADLWIEPPGELLYFLDQWAHAAGSEAADD